jgi:serine/threonine protein kinase
MQGAPEFKVEVELLSRVHHKNLVSLVGFCLEHGEQMLVYEFVPNGDLRDTLSGIPCTFSLYKAYDIKGNILSDNRNTFLSWYRQVRNQVGLDEKT